MVFADIKLSKMDYVILLAGVVVLATYAYLLLAYTPDQIYTRASFKGA